MAILDILEAPHPVLKQVAAPVETFDDALGKLLDDMAETMYVAPGIGLAAPQVGVSRRALVTAVPIRGGWSRELEGDEEEHPRAFYSELINPVIVERDGRICFDEGCLSLPGLEVPVERSAYIRVEAQDRRGEPFSFESEGFYAVVFQHEMDHLEGITLLDSMSALKRRMYIKKRQKVKARGKGS